MPILSLLFVQYTYHTVKSCIKAAACVQFSDFFGRLIFKTGLCAVLHPSDHHKITYCTQTCTQRPIHSTHFLCRVYSELSISQSPFSRSLGPKSITALARDHVQWYAVDCPRMRRDERRLRMHIMTLQTTDLQLLLARRRFPEYGQVVAVCPKADGCDECRSSTTSRCTQLYIFCKSISFAKLITSRVIDLSRAHCTAAAYIQGQLVCRTANQKRGFYSRQAYIQGRLLYFIYMEWNACLHVCA